MITLALTHYNRFALLKEAIEKVVLDSRIAEVVISDDHSTDNSYGDLVHFYSNHPRVKIYRNSANLDCYRNKHAAVRMATYEWVILFDSDNIITPEYLDAIFTLPHWDPDTIYCPEFAQPHFDYTAFSGQVIDKSNVAKFMDRPRFNCLLNTANYFFHRDSFLSVWDGSIDPHTADTIFHAYNWLRKGKRLAVVRNLRYFHRIHAGSHYKQNVHKTGKLAANIETRLRNMR